jgi:hypothetical protein
MTTEKLTGETNPKIIEHKNKKWVVKNNIKNKWYNYHVNFSEHITYSLLRMLNVNSLQNTTKQIDYSNYNLIEYVEELVEYRSLTPEEKQIAIQASRKDLLLIAVANLVVGNDDIHESNFLFSKENKQFYSIDFSDTYLSKIDSVKSDGSIENQADKRVECTLLGNIIKNNNYTAVEFNDAINSIESIPVDEFYTTIETASKLFHPTLSTNKKFDILDRFINAKLYMNEIKKITTKKTNNK